MSHFTMTVYSLHTEFNQLLILWIYGTQNTTKFHEIQNGKNIVLLLQKSIILLLGLVLEIKKHYYHAPVM